MKSRESVNGYLALGFNLAYSCKMQGEKNEMKKNTIYVK